MSSSLSQSLEALAFHRAEPARANVAIDEARELRTADTGVDAVSYEIALPGLAPDEFLLTKALPKLVYFLDCRGVKPPSSGPVFVSLFSERGLFFIDAGPVVEALATARGLTLAELVKRYGESGTGDPLLLGT
ncbi:MAG: STAUR_1299 family protein [Archangium sp.]